MIKQKQKLAIRHHNLIQESIRDNFSQLDRFKHPEITNFGYEVNGKESDGHIYGMKENNETVGLKYIGNISAKGSNQSLIVAGMHAIIKALIDESLTSNNLELKMNQTLKKLHLYIQSFNNSGLGCFLFLALTNLKNGKVWYVNAGMPRPIIFKSGSQMIETPQDFIPDVLAEVIPPLGFDYLETFKISKTELKASECLFVYSNNLPEIKIYGNSRIGRKGIILHCLNSFMNNTDLSDDWNKMINSSKMNNHMPESVAFIFQQLESEWKAEEDLNNLEIAEAQH